MVVNGVGPGISAEVEELFAHSHNEIFELEGHRAGIGTWSFALGHEGGLASSAVTLDEFVHPGL
jgi:hypothetical protein